jgi:sialidase-1
MALGFVVVQLRDRLANCVSQKPGKDCAVKIKFTMILVGLTLITLKAEPFFEHVEVFKAGDNNVHTYRIPGVVVTTKGTILVFCEARKDSERDGSPTDIVLRRSFDNGKTFQPMQTLAVGIIHYLRLPEPDVKVEALMDPTPLVDRSNGTIWLSFTQYLNRKMAKNYLLKSTDDGTTWSKPIDIGQKFGGGFAAGPGMGIQLEYNQEHKGRLVFCGRGHDREGTPGSYIIYSDDHGQTWTKGKAVPEKGVGGECQIIELTDGSLAMNIRSGRQKYRVIALSKTDAGMTWDMPFDEPQLPEYGCQASILRYTDRSKNDKNRILFSNPNTIERDRTNLTVRLSYDEGKTWSVSKVIHPGPAAYSNLAIATNGTILCFYEGGQTHRREWIRLARFNLQWLTDGKDRLGSN